MGFGFRVGVPGLRVRVSTRGVRASAGPRIARLSVGSGGTRVSSGMGPLSVSTSLSGGRRRSRSRPGGPTAAQLERARRQAERAEQQAQRDAAIAELTELRLRTTTVHLEAFPPAEPPVIAPPPVLVPAWALAEAENFHQQGLGVFARSERAAARQRAQADAPAYLAAEQARLQAVHAGMVAQADAWWRALLANDEATVCEAVNAAFADNPAAGCAVGVEGTVLSVVMRQMDYDALPPQMPGLSSAGRPNLRNLAKRDRLLWWLTIMGSHVIATLKEAFATAPGITAVDLAVLTRLPDTQRLGFVAFGRWTRTAIDRTPWLAPEDALLFQDLAQDFQCGVRTTAAGTLTGPKPLNVDRLPGLHALLESAVDDPADLGEIDAALRTSAPDEADPQRFRPFAEWKAAQAHRPLAPGETIPLPTDAQHSLDLAFQSGGAEADLTLFLLDAAGRVRSDADFVFYHQPTTPSVRLLGKSPDQHGTVERAHLALSTLPPDVHRVAIAINMSVDTAQTCAALTHATLWAGPAWSFQAPPDPAVTAMILAELYRHPADGWRLRALGQGWSDGLPALARAHGVDVTG